MTAWLDIDFERAFPRGPTITARIGPQAGCERHPVTVLFGPSGAGKTTLLRCLAGLDRPTRGHITIDGQTWFDSHRGVHTPPQHRRIGYVPQEPSLFPHLTALQNVSYGLRRAPDRASRARDMLDFVGLAPFADRRPSALSGGQRQKLAVARALAPRPALLLLDEPFSSLDGPVRESLRAELRDLIIRACAPAIIVTHDLNEAAAIADQVIVMTDGLIQQIGRTADVLHRPRTAAVAAALGFENILPATIQSTTGTTSTILVGGVTLLATNDQSLTGEALVCIRAQNITLSSATDSLQGGQSQSGHSQSGKAHRTHHPVMNRLTGPIITIRRGMPFDHAIIDCAFPLRVALPKAPPPPPAEGARVSAFIDPSGAALVPKPIAK